TLIFKLIGTVNAIKAAANQLLTENKKLRQEISDIRKSVTSNDISKPSFAQVINNNSTKKQQVNTAPVKNNNNIFRFGGSPSPTQDILLFFSGTLPNVSQASVLSSHAAQCSTQSTPLVVSDGCRRVTSRKKGGNYLKGTADGTSSIKAADSRRR